MVGGLDASRVFRDMRGRAPKPDALVRRRGLDLCAAEGASFRLMSGTVGVVTCPAARTSSGYEVDAAVIYSVITMLLRCYGTMRSGDDTGLFDSEDTGMSGSSLSVGILRARMGSSFVVGAHCPGAKAVRG